MIKQTILALALIAATSAHAAPQLPADYEQRAELAIQLMQARERGDTAAISEITRELGRLNLQQQAPQQQAPSKQPARLLYL